MLAGGERAAQVNSLWSFKFTVQTADYQLAHSVHSELTARSGKFMSDGEKSHF